MIRLGVLGWPVAHSRSPEIQNAALRASGLGDSWRYQLLPVPPELFEDTVRALPQAGFRGVNVTIPHKAAALAVATAASPRAAAIRAANTLLFGDDGEIWADNTDAPALIGALERRTSLAGCSAQVLGAGGTARSAVWALLNAGAREVLIWNRSPGRAAELAAEIGGRAVQKPHAEVDVLVNCTSVGLSGSDTLETLWPSAYGLDSLRAVVDFVYHPDGTPLVHAARRAGVAAIDGLELLTGQGAAGFELFTGLPAPVEAMRQAVGLSSAS